MQMNHVRYFLALCRDKNFTLAAKRCGISQPSLTNAIKRFERELGGPLFHRSLTGTTLSALGQAVRPHLERLIQCADDARRAATTIKSLPQVGSPQQLEVSMHKLMHFTAGVAVGALALVLIKTPTVATGPSTRPQTISVEELQRSIDLSALPVRVVENPF